jgi:hypothetical protein
VQHPLRFWAHKGEAAIVLQLWKFSLDFQQIAGKISNSSGIEISTKNIKYHVVFNYYDFNIVKF